MGIYLGLGSNVGDRAEHFRYALKALSERNISVWRSASLYWTEPRDLEGQPWFLNTVVEIRTLLDPEALLQECLEVERAAGRVRDVPKGPRPLDIDIVLYKDLVVDLPDLTIPHPRYRERRFVLVPLVELAPDIADPACGLTMCQLLDLCQDTGQVRLSGGPLL
jgi:2-amino-4-hydroxy-6-hydroxymethyldihydropteridine diphosphokinase